MIRYYISQVLWGITSPMQYWTNSLGSTKTSTDFNILLIHRLTEMTCERAFYMQQHLKFAQQLIDGKRVIVQAN